MALVADLVAAFRGEVSGIDDRRRGPVAPAREHVSRMARSRSVAALAAGPFGQLPRQGLGAPIAVVARGELRVAIVAEHALMPDAAHHAIVIGSIEAWGHPPRPGLAVPRDRELIELSLGRLIEVDARVMPRAEDPVDRLLEAIDRPALG